MAAEKALKKVEDQLHCSVCLDTYTDPKQLQCFHVYCRQCLVKLVFRDEQKQLVLTCPNCRQVTPIPENGVAGLPPAFHINQLLEIVGAHKNEELPQEVASAVEFCTDHEGKELELYCGTCMELACFKCAITGGKHFGHDCKELNEAFATSKKEIDLSVEDMEEKLSIVTDVLGEMGKYQQAIYDQDGAIKSDIHDSIGQLRRVLLETLDVRERELTGQINGITQERLKGLEVDRNLVENIHSELECYLYTVKMSLNKECSTSQKAMLKQQKHIVGLKGIFKLASDDLPEPNLEAADTVFCASIGSMQQYRNYGKITASGFPDPLNCFLFSKGMTKTAATVGEMSYFTLDIFDFTKKPCKVPLEALEYRLTSSRTGEPVELMLQQGGLNHYEIMGQPTVKGIHQLEVKIWDQHVMGSPFSIQVRSPQEISFKDAISTIYGIAKPWAVAVDTKGRIILSEVDEHCVSIYSPDGMKLLSFGNRGQALLQSPQGVAVDSDGNILVVDSANSNIMKFTAQGQFLAAVGSEGRHGPLRFHLPSGIAFNPTNESVYVSDESDRIQVLNKDLSFSKAFGVSGKRPGQFNSPQGIAFDSTGKVYIADRSNARIQVFLANGQFLKILVDNFPGLNCPTSIAIDKYNDTIYACNNIMGKKGRIFIFKRDGTCLFSTGSTAFTRPTAMAVDASGMVYVCDYSRERVVLF